MHIQTIKILTLFLFTGVCLTVLASGRLGSANGYRDSDDGPAKSPPAAPRLIPSRTGREWDVIRTLSPLPEVLPKETTNSFSDDRRAAELGQQFFFEKDFSGPITIEFDKTFGSGLGKAGETGKISCASCHQPESGWMFDVRSNSGVPGNPNATALGANWTARNSSSIVNSVFYGSWRENDGLSDSAWADSLTDPEAAESQNSSRLRLAHVIWDKYHAEYNAVFATSSKHPSPKLDPRLDPSHPQSSDFPPAGKPGDEAWERMSATDKEIINRIFTNFGKAIEAYLRLCVSRNAPFDQYVAGDDNAISESAKRGLMLFVSERTNCISCHSGPNFTNLQFYTNGMRVDQKLSPKANPEELGRYYALEQVLTNMPGKIGEFNVDSPYSDDTRTERLKGLSPTQADIGKWRTKSLRQVAVTAPYMHTGQMPTLMDVINFYDRGGDKNGTFLGTKDEQIRPLNLSDQEKLDLIEFLKTLTGEPLPPSLIQDTSKRSDLAPVEVTVGETPRVRGEPGRR